MEDGPRRTAGRGWYWLLLLPLLGTLIPPIYNRADPTFIGIPFFYWYQMLWVLISAALTMTAYRLWQRDQRARAAQQGGEAK
jgi:Protein of unknown function (DUF3311)